MNIIVNIKFAASRKKKKKKKVFIHLKVHRMLWDIVREGRDWRLLPKKKSKYYDFLPKLYVCFYLLKEHIHSFIAAFQKI